MFAAYNYETEKVVAVFTARAAAEAFCRLADPFYLFLDVQPLPGVVVLTA
jgi:hypothetical protein